MRNSAWNLPLLPVIERTVSCTWPVQSYHMRSRKRRRALFEKLSYAKAACPCAHTNTSATGCMHRSAAKTWLEIWRFGKAHETFMHPLSCALCHHETKFLQLSVLGGSQQTAARLLWLSFFFRGCPKIEKSHIKWNYFLSSERKGHLNPHFHHEPSVARAPMLIFRILISSHP